VAHDTRHEKTRERNPDMTISHTQLIQQIHNSRAMRALQAQADATAATGAVLSPPAIRASPALFAHFVAGVTPHTTQAQFLEDRSPVKVAACGRRWGKSTAALDVLHTGRGRRH